MEPEQDWACSDTFIEFSLWARPEDGVGIPMPHSTKAGKLGHREVDAQWEEISRKSSPRYAV